MKEKRIKKLNSELRYLLKEEREKEIIKYAKELEDNTVDIETIIQKIYAERGIDYHKLNKRFMTNLLDSLEDLGNSFKNKDSKTRRQMIIELVYIVLILALIKLPFDLIRDIGYDYLNILTTNNLLDTLWNLVFLILYTLTFVCTFIILIKNFNKKY